MTSEKIRLRSRDGAEFLVPKTVARQSNLLRLIVDNHLLIAYFQNSITLYTITGPILAKVIEYWAKHETTGEGSSTTPASSKMSVEELRNWDKQFVEVDPATLHALTEAADYLEIEGLQGLINGN